MRVPAVHETEGEWADPAPPSRARRAGLVVLLVLTTITPSCLLDEPEARSADPMTRETVRPADDGELWWPCWAGDYECEEEG